MKLGTFAIATLLLTIPAWAEEKVELKVGDKAPVFEGVDDNGKAWKSSDHVGKKIVVVYFYPADCTGGCTKQAQGYRDSAKDLAEKGVEVVGVSGDSVKNHQIFKKQESLNFTLLADEDGKIADKFGVPAAKGEKEAKSKAGDVLKRNVTAQRWTFVIGKDGKIVKAYKVNDAGGDSKEILKIVDAK